MRRILAQARIELIQLSRDRLSMIFPWVLPLVILIILGSTFKLTGSNLLIVGRVLYGSTGSRQFADAFRGSNSLCVVSWPTDRQPQDAFTLDKARAAIIIPAHFERELLRGRTSPVQMLADGSDANTASLVAGYVRSIVNAYNASHSGQTNLQPVQAEIRLWFNPGLDSLKFTGPGVFVLVMSMNAPLIACLAMAKESETKTILQVYASSISAIEFVLGNILAFTIVGLAESVPLLISLTISSDAPLFFEPRSFFVATRLYCFCVAAFGVF